VRLMRSGRCKPKRLVFEAGINLLYNYPDFESAEHVVKQHIG
jgi:hypothetical protein